MLIVAVFCAATATCKTATSPRTPQRSKAKTKSSTASFYVEDDATTAATTRVARRTTKTPSSLKSDDKRLSLNSLLGNWDYSLTSEDYYYYYYFDEDEDAAKDKAKVSANQSRFCDYMMILVLKVST